MKARNVKSQISSNSLLAGRQIDFLNLGAFRTHLSFLFRIKSSRNMLFTQIKPICEDCGEKKSRKKSLVTKINKTVCFALNLEQFSKCYLLIIN